MTLPPKRLAVEAVPVAAILLFWNLLATVAHVQNVGGPVRDAGLLVAGLYVVVRGVALSDLATRPATVDLEAVLRENARLAVPAGAWFVAAMVVGALESWILEFGGVLTAIRGALGGAGLAVVGLYVVAAGYATFGDGSTTDSGASPDEGVADDGTATENETPTDGTSADD